MVLLVQRGEGKQNRSCTRAVMSENRLSKELGHSYHILPVSATGNNLAPRPQANSNSEMQNLADL